jgi:hypothetical protein
VSFLQSGLSVIGKLTVIIILLGAFLFGLGGTLYMALRSPEVKVPEIVGKDALESEKTLESLGLKMRRRTTRFSEEKPNTILEQSPLAGENVKTGQTVAVVVSRAEAEGDEKPAEVKKETVDTAPKPDEPVSEVDKSRQKRKAANANANKNANKNGNSNSSNRSTNVNSNSNSNGGNSNAITNSNSRPDANTRNSNSGGNSNNRPANTNPVNRNANNRVINANRPPETNRRNP